ncbi:hypothetical protein TIFTF001_020482 [Ficus carica]|uniref:Uncharacterized protein n=1 Tax=Ficus carica TaxID=3494 RepID=A0AA88AU32_FICCA|nr:hypothetical protein TIFTF001_020482 [Ficus carica]
MLVDVIAIPESEKQVRRSLPGEIRESRGEASGSDRDSRRPVTTLVESHQLSLKTGHDVVKWSRFALFSLSSCQQGSEISVFPVTLERSIAITGDHLAKVSPTARECRNNRENERRERERRQRKRNLILNQKG